LDKMHVMVKVVTRQSASETSTLARMSGILSSLRRTTATSRSIDRPSRSADTATTRADHFLHKDEAPLINTSS
jgi:hypothetical protein